MRWGFLGPLQVLDDTGSQCTLPTGRVRVMLAALLTQANQVVSIDGLSEFIWDGAPPPGAARTVRVYATRLRRTLGPSASERIVTQAPGYLCRVGRDELDVLLVEELSEQAACAAHEQDWARATELLADALALWRGTPLADVPCEQLRSREIPRLDRLRLRAVEGRVTAEMNLNRHEQLIPQLRELTAGLPLHENFHAHLMTALARTGRRAEALEAYRDARRVLVEELGIEPGPNLRAAHQRVLSGETESEPASALPGVPASDEATPAASSPRPPRQLPAAPGHFTGRDAELDRLTALSEGAGKRTGTVVISAIDGMAGIGKTALALHAAHRLAEEFPGGQLFIDLHGYTKGYPPRTPSQALEWLLRALGVSAQQIPEETEARAALYRQHLADTRTLIVLDNALDETQVRPLLPGHPECLVLVTSRRRLKGLDDACSLSLGVLSAPDAVALLAAAAGPGRVRDGDPLASEVAELCGRLPLALRIAGALLRHRPTWGLEHLASLLRDRLRRAAALADGERDLAGLFDLSYTGLDSRHQVLFRRLGLVPGPEVDAYAAAALLECDPKAATGLLEDLFDHNLLIEHVPSRYRLHDLLRSHARALADQDPDQHNRAALDRLLCYYAHTARTASIPIARYPRRAPDGPAPVHAPALRDPHVARAWLHAEQPNLEAAFTHARDHGLDGHAIALAAGLAEILRTDGPIVLAIDLHRAAADSAERSDRPDSRASALAELGVVRRINGDLPGAGDALAQALEIYRVTDDRNGEAGALIGLGIVRLFSGDLPGAGDALALALEIYRAIDSRHGEAAALTDLGAVRRLAGELPQARDALTQALEIYREIGNRSGEANALTDLCAARRLSGDLCGAEVATTRALGIYRAIRNRSGEASALTELGAVRHKRGDLARAESAHAQALRTYRAIGNRNGEAFNLTELGAVRLERGDEAGADDALTRALEIYRAIGNRREEANALTEWGRVRQATGDLTAAEGAQARALEIYRALDDHSNEAWALNHYAATLAAAGQRRRGLAVYRKALAMNRELEQPADEAVSLEGLAECHLATGETEIAATHLRQALESYRRLGMTPDTERVRARLAETGPATPR